MISTVEAWTAIAVAWTAACAIGVVDREAALVGTLLGGVLTISLVAAVIVA